MTKLLEIAIAEAKKAPSEVQNDIADLVLAALRDEARWGMAFAGTTDEQLDRMTEMVRDEIKRGDTEPIDCFLK